MKDHAASYTAWILFEKIIICTPDFSVLLELMLTLIFNSEIILSGNMANQLTYSCNFYPGSVSRT